MPSERSVVFGCAIPPPRQLSVANRQQSHRSRRNPVRPPRMQGATPEKTRPPPPCPAAAVASGSALPNRVSGLSAEQLYIQATHSAFRSECRATAAQSDIFRRPVERSVHARAGSTGRGPARRMASRRAVAAAGATIGRFFGTILSDPKARSRPESLPSSQITPRTGEIVPVPLQRSHPPVGMRPQHSPTSATHLRSADRQCYNRFQPCRPFVVRQRLPASDLPIRRNSGPQKCLFRPSRSFICDDPPASSVRSCRPPPVRRAAVPHVRSARHRLRYCPIRCRTTSKSITAAAAETLSDSICPISGMASCSSQSLSTSFEIPRSSAPITSTVGRRKSAS